MMKIIPYLPCLIIFISSIIFYLLSDYNLVESLRKIYVPILIAVIGMFLLLQDMGIQIIKEVPKFKALPLLILLLGIYLVVLSQRAEYLKPIHEVSGKIILNIEPRKFEKKKFSSGDFGFVNLIGGKRACPLLDVNKVSDYGKNGLISTLFLDLSKHFLVSAAFSPFSDGLPYHDIYKYDSIQLILPMLSPKTVILGGTLRITINNDRELNFEIPEQLYSNLLHIPIK